MADDYTPQFQHQDWRDNVDLVSAEDPVQGFNKRFNDLKKEFQEISRIIGQINGSLVPSSTTLTFAPSFSPNGTTTPWTISRGIASKGTNQPQADGWLSAQLPQGSRMQTMTVIGDKSGNVGTFQARLVRQTIVGGADTTLVSLDLASQPDSFQAAAPVQLADNLVENQTYKYIVSVRIIGADPASTARIFAIQFACNRT